MLPEDPDHHVWEEGEDGEEEDEEPDGGGGEDHRGHHQHLRGERGEARSGVGVTQEVEEGGAEDQRVGDQVEGQEAKEGGQETEDEGPADGPGLEEEFETDHHHQSGVDCQPEAGPRQDSSSPLPEEDPAEEDDAGVPERQQEPEQQLDRRQQLVPGDPPVELRALQETLRLEVAGDEPEDEDGERSEGHVVGGEVGTVEESLGGEVGEEGVVELVGEAGEVLVEAVLDDDGGPEIDTEDSPASVTLTNGLGYASCIDTLSNVCAYT